MLSFLSQIHVRTCDNWGTKTAFLPVRGVPYETGVYLQSQQKHAILGHGGTVTRMSFRGLPSFRYGGNGLDKVGPFYQDEFSLFIDILALYCSPRKVHRYLSAGGVGIRRISGLWDIREIQMGIRTSCDSGV